MNNLIKKIYLTVMLFIYMSIGICQEVFFDKLLLEKIDEKINVVKEKMICNSIDKNSFEETFPCGDKIDTALFKYIPVVNGSIFFQKIDSTYYQNNFFINEILLYHKREKKIIGSGQIGKKDEIYLTFVNSKHYVSKVPMRYESRLTYLSSKEYSLVSKFLIEEDYFLIYISEIKALCLFNKEGVFIKLIQKKSGSVSN
jgi:hypothetical protein